MSEKNEVKPPVKVNQENTAGEQLNPAVSAVPPAATAVSALIPGEMGASGHYNQDTVLVDADRYPPGHPNLLVANNGAPGTLNSSVPHAHAAAVVGNQAVNFAKPADVIRDPIFPVRQDPKAVTGLVHPAQSQYEADHATLRTALEEFLNKVRAFPHSVNVDTQLGRVVHGMRKMFGIDSPDPHDDEDLEDAKVEQARMEQRPLAPVSAAVGATSDVKPELKTDAEKKLEAESNKPEGEQSHEGDQQHNPGA